MTDDPCSTVDNKQCLSLLLNVNVIFLHAAPYDQYTVYLLTSGPLEVSVCQVSVTTRTENVHTQTQCNASVRGVHADKSPSTLHTPPDK